MVEDFELNLDILLKRDLVEANTRVDYFSDVVDSIKITTYGLYVFNVLSSYFTYIELISTDCGYFNEETASSIVALSNEDYRFFQQRKRLDRVNCRLNKTETFIKYLMKEEESELEFYGATSTPRFSEKIFASFNEEKQDVLKSAQRRGNR